MTRNSIFLILFICSTVLGCEKANINDYSRVKIGDKSFCIPKSRAINSDQLGMFPSKKTFLYSIPPEMSKSKGLELKLKDQNGITVKLGSKVENNNLSFIDSLLNKSGRFKNAIVVDAPEYSGFKVFEAKNSMFWHLIIDTGVIDSDNYIGRCAETSAGISCQRKLFFENLYIEYDLHDSAVEMWKEVDEMVIQTLNEWSCE